MALPRSLGASINWQDVLPLLGVDIPLGVLPIAVQCPLCKERTLRVFQDTTFGGEWHHCSSCKSSGDMILLAAKTWKANLTQTLGRLRELGAFPRLWTQEEEDGHRRFLANLDEVTSYWRKIQRDQVVKDGRKDFYYLRIDLGNNWARWKERMGPIVSVGKREDLLEGVVKRGLTSRLASSFLVIPFSDLPGRITGFHLISGSLDHAGSSNYSGFRRMDIAERLKGHRPGFGALATLPVADHPKFGNVVFLVANVLRVIKAHEKHSVDSAIPLPLLAFDPSEGMLPRFDYGLLVGKRVVIVCEEATPELICLAREADGFLAVGVAGGLVATHSRFWKSPEMCLQEAADVALPWHRHIEEKILAMGDLEAEAFLDRLGFASAGQKEEFIRACGSQAQEKLLRLGKRLRTTSVNLGTQTVVEKNGCWHVKHNSSSEGSAKLLCDALLRIDRVITGEVPFYQGRIIFQNEEVPFLEPVSVVEANTKRWMREYLLRHGKGLMTFSRPQGVNIVSLAAQFQPPETVSGASRYGWSEKHAAFVFAKFAIALKGGEILDVPATFLPTPASPTLECSLEEFTPDEIGLLSQEDHVTAVAWSVAICIIANLIASVRNSPKSGLLLLGGAITGGRLAAGYLGCGEDHPRPGSHLHNQEAFRAAQAAHDWPLVIQDRELGRAHTQIADCGSNNCIAALTWPSTQVLGMAPGWHILEDEETITSMVGYRLCLSKLIPSYLRWACKRNLTLPERASLAETVAENVARWFSSLGGVPQAPLLSLSYLSPDRHGSPAGKAASLDRLAIFLCKAFKDGETGFRTRITPFGWERLMGLTEEGLFFLSKPGFEFLLARKSCPALASDVITDLLATGGVLLGEDSQDPRNPVWLIDGEWWKQKYATWGVKDRGAFKVVG